MTQRQDRQPQTADTRSYSPAEDPRPPRTLVSPTRCSCGGNIDEGDDICNLCRFDHASQTYA